MLLAAGALPAAEPLRIELSGGPGIYTKAQWKRDWPGCLFANGVEEGRFALANRDGQTTLPGAAETLQVDRTGLRFRDTADYAINGLLFNTFHGGNDASWGPARPVSALFGGFELR